MSVPKSVLFVMSGIPVDSSFEHCLWFANPTAQWQYFSGKIAKSFSAYTYLRENNSIKVTGDIAEAQAWNYCMYTNGDGLEYYNFITRVEYVNDVTVILHLELDVIQTYMFKWNMQQCFVERTHTRTDNFGEHTIPEGLETGPLIDNYIQYINLEDLCILIQSAMDTSGNASFGGVYDGVMSGLDIYAVDVSRHFDLSKWLLARSEDGTIDGIVSMWMYPKELVDIVGEWNDSNLLHEVYGSKWVNKEINQQHSPMFGTYIPDNKKLYCYPYQMLYVTNNLGGSAVYRPELFSKGASEPFTFNIMGGIAPDTGAQLVPCNYKKMLYNYDEALSLPAFPTCAWNSDTYKVWLAQNQHTQDLAMKSAVIQAGAGVLTSAVGVVTGNVMGAAAGVGMGYNALMNVQSIMAQRADMEVQPPQARGNHSANLNLANGRQGFDILYRCITEEYARSIDQYLTRYGYKVNTFMTPNLKARERFTYIKTVDCMVTCGSGSFSDENRRKIQSIFDKGVTFWVDPERVGNYTLGNNVL